MKKRKEVFGFRKSKVAKTLCGAVLGAALLAMVDQQVAAEETTKSNSTTNVAVTTTGNPATNLPGVRVRKLNKVKTKLERQMVQYQLKYLKLILIKPQRRLSLLVSMLSKMPMLIKEQLKQLEKQPKKKLKLKKITQNKLRILRRQQININRM